MCLGDLASASVLAAIAKSKQICYNIDPTTLGPICLNK